MEQLLTIDLVADYLNVSRKAARRLVARRGPRIVRFGRVLRLERGDVFRWLYARIAGRDVWSSLGTDYSEVQPFVAP